MQDDIELMRFALDAASRGRTADLPIVAVISDSKGKVLALARNGVIASDDSTSHAELTALRQIGSTKLKDYGASFTMAVTLEPCPMCAWALRESGIGRVVYGAYNENYGAGGSVYDLLRDPRFGKPVEVVGGVLEAECSRQLRQTFGEIRDNNRR